MQNSAHLQDNMAIGRVFHAPMIHCLKVIT